MTTYRFPLNKPSVVGKELQYVDESIRGGKIGSAGPYTKKCELLLEQTLGVPKAMLTTSCTDALEIAALLLDIKRGDEVIVPSFTYPSTVTPFVLRGARPIFSDIRSDTLNIDETKLESLITQRTKAIVLMHYAGVGCEMESILEIADRHGVAVVEDNALGLFSKYKGRYLGTFGCLSAVSFNETKSIICGEGGALLVNNPKYIERAEIIREKGTDRSRFLRGEIDQYTWVDDGSSHAPSDILAAFLYGQLEEREMIEINKRRIWKYYYEHLQCWATRADATLPVVPEYCEPSYCMFHLLMPSFEERKKLMQRAGSRGVLATFHYLPLHLSKMGRKFGKEGECPVTERISDRLVRLPFYNSLSKQDQAFVIAALADGPMLEASLVETLSVDD